MKLNEKQHGRHFSKLLFIEKILYNRQVDHIF